jgi:pheromone shutdown protein TraB
MTERAASDAGASASEGSVRVVGTAHVSADSVDEVERVIHEERPDVVAVELDEGRYRQMQGEAPEDLQPGDLLRGNTVFQFIAYWMLSYVQTQMGEKFDIQPGADMLAACETAEELETDLALVDRDIQTTIQRFWARMTLREKLHMVGGLAFGVTDPRVVGLVAGLVVGLVAGPVIGLLGESVFGIGLPLLTRITGGLVLTVAAAYVFDLLGRRTLDPDRSFLYAIAGALAVGLVGGVGLGLADPLVTAVLGDFAIRIVGSMGLGVGLGVLVGAVAGAVIDLLGWTSDATGDYEEFDMSELTDTDVVSVMMDEFRQFSPGGAEALIDERDAYIAHNLVGLREQGHRVVAVVGAGHREGIERYLADPASLPPMESLTGTQESTGVPWGKILAFGVSAAFIGFFVLLAMAGVRNDFLLRLFAAWFVVNGVFAAGLAKLAGARWTSSLVGGLVAWMTSVNPLLAPGWFTGYMELRHTPVNVADISTLNQLLSDEEKPLKVLVAEMFDVPLFRLIMVVAATNIGSIVASLLFVTYVLPLFGQELGGVDGVTRLMLDGARSSADLLWRAVT